MNTSMKPKTEQKELQNVALQDHRLMEPDSVSLKRSGSSRLHSACKRFSWTLVWNGAFVLFELARLPEFFGFSVDNVARLTLVQVFLVPAVALAWGLFSPRKYSKCPHWLELFLFVPLFAIGFFLSEMAFVFSWWNIFPPQFAR